MASTTTATAGAQATKVKKTKAASKTKKPVSSAAKKSSLAHPTFLEMITDAIVTLKERTGSSQYAINKFIEEKHKKDLPSNFKKLLLFRLKKLVESGKLFKVKNSFKLSASGPVAAKPKTTSATVIKKKLTKSASAPVKAAAKVVKPKAKVAPIKTKAAILVKKSAAKTKKTVKPLAVKKTVKKPKTKSVKSPAKKAPASKKVKK